jgi:hypothetical protein
MTSQEMREFFNREGYWPMPPMPERKLSSRDLADMAARRLQQSLKGSFLRGWKAPLHWTVPPAFEKPGRIYEQVGHEEFCRMVEDYYANISQVRVEKACRAHTKWAIRQILRTFETHVRGFRGQSVSKAGPYGSGGRIFDVASDVLVLPETLVQDGRLIAYLRDYLKTFGVRKEDLEASERLIKFQLTRKWGIQV